MKNNFNPYTVPENFFENNCRSEILRYRNRRRAVLCSAAAVVAAALIIAAPSFIGLFSSEDAVGRDALTNELARMYEYDIFLQVNF